ncbi:alpha-hydroxy acid oxidase [Pseudonocardia broussonetiae]|uniref:Alpha-hydroxy-acid oxidizing protein n=1 Tax=Pseudonocardia broussonetiae TaxID=2736640 RepID=A0A6M6JQI7_9PSEU|nr:alpha-hydroxy acid oxidase [Pseudonocardia broussonetiae]QJY48862.1 alpha-hydroxy-acid oxidizing protein [Pseudonocardia broussonetiae]
MTARRLPPVAELAAMVDARAFAPATTRRRLARTHTLEDLRALARRRVPRAVFDYVEGGAEQEVSIARSRAAFRDVRFRPQVLRDVGEVDLGRTMLGRRAELPVVLAPTGYTRMMHHEGERAVARAAARAGIPYALSTVGTTSVEDLVAAAPTGRTWFQLYLWRDRAASAALVARALAAGCDTMILTVDTPVSGARFRDVRNGLTIPPRIGPRTLADMALHPRWWIDLVSTEPLRFASFSSWQGTAAELADSLFDPTAGLADLRWLRDAWPHRLVVKGIQGVADARTVLDAGADGVVLSNHGGRQLDRTEAPLRLLPEVRAALGADAEVYVDGGVTSGADVAAAVALGATGVLVGRAYLYGLMAGGEAGVARAVDILRTDLARTLRLLGVTAVDALTGTHAALGDRPHHRPTDVLERAGSS